MMIGQRQDMSGGVLAIIPLTRKRLKRNTVGKSSESSIRPGCMLPCLGIADLGRALNEGWLVFRFGGVEITDW